MTLAHEGELDKRPAKSFNGRKEFYCRTCEQVMPVAFHVTGVSTSNDGETYYWNYCQDAKGHTLRDDSY